MPFRSRQISQDVAQGAADGAPAQPAAFDLGWTLQILRRNFGFIATVVGAFLALAVVYLTMATPIYTATGELIFDLREPKVVSNNPILQSLGADQYVIDSQVEVVKSLSVAKRVINQLGLRKPPEPAAGTTWRRFFDFGSKPTPVASDEIPQAEYEAFARRLTVQRKGVSFVILVSYSHPDPVKAAAITNAVMESYTSEQKKVKVETISAANSWLQSRVDELRQKVIESERRVQQFKTEDAAIDAKVMNTIYATFLTRLKETQSQEALQSSDARIVSSAVPPAQPSSPKKMLTMALALALGLSLGAMVAVLRGMIDPLLRDAGDVTRLTDTAVLATLPRRSAEEMQQLAVYAAQEADNETNERGNSVVLRPQDSPYGQAVFALRQAIVETQPLEAHKLVAIVSPRSGEGKTTTAINLAREAALSGVRTLLIDGDLRAAAASELLAPGGRERSLVDVVAGTAALKDVLVQDQLSPMQVCPAPDAAHAVPRPTDVLAGRNFAKLARDLRKDFDLVVIDTPGFLEYPDGRALLRVVDRLVVVADLGHTAREDLGDVLKAASVLPSGQVGLALNASGNKPQGRGGIASLRAAWSVLARKVQPT
jgi:capsular exopolysaccharide synthesis family protein